MEAESLSTGSPAAAMSADAERGTAVLCTDTGGTGAEDFVACGGGFAALRTGDSGLPAAVAAAMPFVLCRYMISDYRINCTFPQVSL